MIHRAIEGSVKFVLLLLLSLSTALAGTINVGIISFDQLIAPGPGAGVNAINLSNLTGDPNSGGFSLPPDFPVLAPLILMNAIMDLTIDGSPTTIMLGDVGPGSFDSSLGLQFADIASISSGHFSAQIDTLPLLLSDGTLFTPDSSAVTADLLPSLGAALTPGLDLTLITVSGGVSSVPEPGAGLLSWVGVALLIFRRKVFSKGFAIVLVTIGPATHLALCQTGVTLTATPSPPSGQPGVTNVILTGSGFPDGTILSSNTNVILQPAAGGAAVTTTASAVTTVVGSTRRVTFLIPSSITVASPTAYLVSLSGSTTTGTAFQSLNKAQLTINPPPSISVGPNTGALGQTLNVTITGILTNFVQGSTQANFGAGISVGGSAEGSFGPVTVTSGTSATAQLKINSAAQTGSRNVVVQTGAQQATLLGGFTVGTSTFSITDFTPKTASVGTLVSISGSNLPAGPVITLARQGGGTVTAPIEAALPTALTFTVPTSVVSGSIALTANGVTVNSATPLTIVPSSSFTMAALPAAVNLIRGQSASYAVSLASNTQFDQLADLSVTGLPLGVTGTFKPSSITAGQISILSLTAPANQTPGTSLLTISASAQVDGLAILQTTGVSLQVVAPSTSFIGRTVVSDALETPLSGVTVKMLGKDGNGGTTGCTGSTTSDGAGNFALTNLPAACTGPQLIGFDGTTATSPPGVYAGVNLAYILVAGQVTASPVLVHLPRIDNREIFPVTQNAGVDQTYNFQTIPGLSVTVYAHTTFTMPDGSVPNPFPLVAVNVPLDRLPDLKPPVPTMVSAFIVAFQPANVTASQPVAVTYPNTLSTPPGTNMSLMTLDPTHGAMVPYGTGTVSANDTQVIPDPDPAHPGHLYGIVHFDWHGPMPPPPDHTPRGCGFSCSDQDGPGSGTNNPGNPDPNNTDNPGNDGNPGGNPPCSGDPVDPVSGLEILMNRDIGIFGPRGSIYIERTYRTLFNTAGPFGIGTQHNYGYLLDTGDAFDLGSFDLITPDNVSIPFSKQSDGTFINSTVPNYNGAVATVTSNNQVTLRRRDGRQFIFQPDGRFLSRMVSISDANGNTITLNRNSSNLAQLLEVVDPTGRKLTLTYDSSNRITSISDPIGRKVSYSYDSGGRLATFTNLEGGVTSYTYDGQNRLLSVTDARGLVIAANTYNTVGQVDTQTLGDGSVLRFQYNVVNPTTTFSPDLQTTITDGRGNQFSYRFDAQGFLVGFADAKGQTRTLVRDEPPPPPPGPAPLARPVSHQLPPNVILPGSERVLMVSGNAVCSACGDSSQGAFTYTYDTSGNMTSKTDSRGNVTIYTYEAVFNKVTSIQDALGQTTKYAYDNRGNLLTVTDPRQNITHFTYNSFGQVTQITDAANQSTIFTYDSDGNLATATDALGKAQSFRYDSVSRLVEVTDRLGRKSSTVYDRMNRITSTRDGKGQITSFTYDPVGNVLQVKDARGNIAGFSYDPLSRVKTRTSPLGKIASWTYDANGNVMQYVDRRGQVSNFTYDRLDRLVHESYQDGSQVDRTYHANSLLAQVTDSGGGVFSFTYDSTGRLTNESGPFGTVKYTRDPLWRVASRQVVGQSVVSYNYDGAGNMTGANSSPASATFTYDSRNLMSSQARSNGVNSNYAYDAVGRVLSIAHQKGATVINSHVMTYDAVGNRLDNQTNISNPLITAAAASTFDVENRMLTRGTSTYTYDDNGNRLTETNPTGTTTYSWDTRNRLTSIVTPQGQTFSFKYDFAGLMIRKQVSGGGISSSDEQYVLDDRTNVVWQNVNGQNSSILSGRTIDQHIAVVGGGSPSFGLADAVNSTVATTDGNGTQSGMFTYEPFGQISSQAQQFPFQFTGRNTVGFAFLYYYRHRFYDAVSGRFISQDPTDLQGYTRNSYSYALNRPVVLRDPVGLNPVLVDAALDGAEFVLKQIAKKQAIKDFFNDDLGPEPPPDSLDRMQSLPFADDRHMSVEMEICMDRCEADVYDDRVNGGQNQCYKYDEPVRRHMLGYCTLVCYGK